MTEEDGRNLETGNDADDADSVRRKSAEVVEGGKRNKLTTVTEENADQIVEKIVDWLRNDLKVNPVRFFGPNPVDYNENPIPLRDLLGFVDSRFVRMCKNVVSTAVEAREMMDFTDANGNNTTEPLFQDSCVVVVYELFRTLVFHHGHRRGTGHDYTYSHLVGEPDPKDPSNVKNLGTTLILMKLTGLCSLSSSLGGIKHDDKEDVKGMTDEKLMDVDLYMHRFEEVNSEKIQRLVRSVIGLVSGVTKVSGFVDLEGLQSQHAVKFEDYKEATFYQFLVQMEKDIRVAFVKFADRLHNMVTIMGHTDKGKREEIARETVEIYLPLARLLKVEELIKELVDLCVQVLNPELYSDFHKASEKRVSEMDENASEILSKVGGCLGITDPEKLAEVVKFSPFRLEHYTQHFAGGLETLKFSDFKINQIDPMQEIVVLVDDPNQIHSVARDVEVALNFISSDRVSLLSAPSQDSPTHWKVPDDTKLASYDDDDVDVVGDGGSVESNTSSFVQRGVLITGFSSTYKCQLRIRVNDKRSEYRKRRGVQANANRAKAPDDLLKDLRYLINLKKERPQDNVLEESRDHLLGPRTCFYTPHGDLRIIPAEACYAEAAFGVHSIRGVAIKGAEISRSLNAGQGTPVRSVLDAVPFVVLGAHDVPMIFFDSVPIGRKGGVRLNDDILGEIDACPGWLVFFKDRKAIGHLRRFFKKPFKFLGIDRTDLKNYHATYIFGQHYLNRLAGIFGRGVVDKCPNSNSAYQVGLGEIDMFSEVTDLLRFDEDNLYIETNVSGNDHDYFSRVIEEAGFVPKYISERLSSSGGVKRFYTVPVDKDSDPYDLCKALLRLSYVFDLSIKRGLVVKDT